jgi:hypothetical protein
VTQLSWELGLARSLDTWIGTVHTGEAPWVCYLHPCQSCFPEVWQVGTSGNDVAPL